MYKAIKKIGGYGIGDIIPDSIALVWLEMYKEPHVEEVKERVVSEKKSIKNSKVKVKEIGSLNNILDDYLGRNQSVVKKNLFEDNFNKNQLKELLKLEESDKKRPLVINAIKQNLKK